MPTPHIKLQLIKAFHPTRVLVLHDTLTEGNNKKQVQSKLSCLECDLILQGWAYKFILPFEIGQV